MQDRPDVINEVEQSRDEMLLDVKKMARNFFEEQPVKGKTAFLDSTAAGNC